MDAKDEAAALQRHLAELETRKLEMEARLSTAKFALQRLSSFVSVRGTELQCPTLLDPQRGSGQPSVN